jgi:hypothetical protein
MMMHNCFRTKGKSKIRDQAMRNRFVGPGFPKTPVRKKNRKDKQNQPKA